MFKSQLLINLKDDDDSDQQRTLLFSPFIASLPHLKHILSCACSKSSSFTVNSGEESLVAAENKPG